jgi:DNA-binding response OmpR family regulator
MALGMNDYMSKPVDQRQLHSKIFALLGKAQAPAEAVHANSGPSASGIAQDELDGLFRQMDRARAS